MDRKSISKKLRFEIFKRDSFCCQYCGKSSPDVVLEINHINPIAKGGKNDSLNLITACFDCNRGKSDRQLSSNAEMSKQIDQLAVMNERKNQLEMMFRWKKELIKQKDYALKETESILMDIVGGNKCLTESGKNTLAQYLLKFTSIEIIDAFHIMFLKTKTFEESFKKIPNIINAQKLNQTKPYMKDLFYIRGIIRNRFNYPDKYNLYHLEKMLLSGISAQEMMFVAKKVSNWYNFFDELNCGDIE